MRYRTDADGSVDFHIVTPDPNETTALEASRVSHRPYLALWKPSQHSGFLTTPSHYPTRIEIHNHGQVVPFFLRPDIGDITLPNLVWLGSIELTIQCVWNVRQLYRCFFKACEPGCLLINPNSRIKPRTLKRPICSPSSCIIDTILQMPAALRLWVNSSLARLRNRTL